MNVVLISTYELGRQPFGLASPAAWLRRAGAEVTCLDLSCAPGGVAEPAVCTADLVAFYVPMHTATRLAIELLPAVRALNPRAHLCCYGLYAAMNEAYLRRLGAQTILSGECEPGLVALVQRLAAERVDSQAGWDEQPEQRISLDRLQFLVPDRSGLPPLNRYAKLVLPDGARRTVGYTEASRGCKHRCRHCPIVPVYDGVFRIVQRDVVLEDIRRQVAAGAQHITFGDPDFFNAPAHGLAIVEQAHREFPRLTYDVTIKIEHLLKNAHLLPCLRETGCLFITSAAESVDDAVLARLAKGHTRADLLAAVQLCREAGLALHLTFVPFTPWTTLEGYMELLALLAAHDLVENVAPVQLAIRLLIPAGSRLLELEEVHELVGPFDEAALVYPWRHLDARVDRLAEEIHQRVRVGEKMGLPRARIFARLWQAAAEALAEREVPASPLPARVLLSRAAIPFLTEPWYC